MPRHAIRRRLVVAVTLLVALSTAAWLLAPRAGERGPADRDVPGVAAGGSRADLLSGHQVYFERQIRRGWRTDFGRHIVPLNDFLRGGPPRDGIPPLDHPRTASQPQGDRFLRAHEPVIAVEIGGHARAYPYRLLIWHEIANDLLGGHPIAVTYCPLCNSAIVWDRRVRHRVLRFGTTGNLRNSDLVMWDNRTQSWWQQLTGKALVGAYAGTRLHALASQTLSWADFKARYPGGDVLSQRTGYDRPYGINPYNRYDAPTGQPFRFNGRSDVRLPPMTRVAAVTVHGDTAVVPFATLTRSPAFQTAVGGAPVVVFYKPGVTSALDASSFADARDVGTAGAFDRRVAGRTLDFTTSRPGAFADRQTGSVWDITGRAIAGPLRGTRLTPVPHGEQFWFAVAAFYPRARIP